MPERIEQFEGALRRADLQVRDPVARVHVDRYGEAECDEAIDRAVKLREQAGRARTTGKRVGETLGGDRQPHVREAAGMQGREHRHAGRLRRHPIEPTGEVEAARKQRET